MSNLQKPLEYEQNYIGVIVKHEHILRRGRNGRTHILARVLLVSTQSP